MKSCSVLFALAIGLVASAWGQDAGPTGTPAPATAQDGYASAQSLERYREGNASMLMNDYGQLARYRDDDMKLGPPATGEQRVIFFGDSITDSWKLDEWFPGKHYINRGISGQTTEQMLVRFREDVIDLKPAVVVVLAGTNDIAGNTGDETLEQIEDDYATMADLTKANGVRLVFSSVMPINDYNQRSLKFFLQRSPEKIVALNAWLKKYCGDNSLVYLDYFSAMVDGRGMLKGELTGDGLHPNAAGFAVMAPLAESAIRQAIGSRE